MMQSNISFSYINYTLNTIRNHLKYLLFRSVCVFVCMHDYDYKTEMCSRWPSRTHAHARTHNENKEINNRNTLWTITLCVRTVNQFRNCEIIAIDGCCWCCVCVSVCICKRARSRAHNKGWVWFVLFSIFDFASFSKIYYKCERGRGREWHRGIQRET